MRSWIILVLFLAVSLASLATGSNTPFDRGLAFLKNREYKEALKQLDIAKGDMNVATSGRSFVVVLFAQAKAYSHLYEMEAAIDHYQQGAEIAKFNGWVDLQAKGINAVAGLHYFRRDYDLARDLVVEILEMSLPDSLHTFTSDSYTYLANIASRENRVDSAIFYVLQAIKIDSLNQDSSSMPFNRAGYASYLGSQGRNNEAIQQYLLGIDYLRGEGDDFKRASIFCDIGQLFLRQHNVRKAKEYGQKSFEISTRLSLKRSKSWCHMLMSQILREETKFDEALIHADSALVLFTTRKSPDGMLRALSSKAQLFVLLDQPDSASNILLTSKEMLDQVKDSFNKLEYYIASAQLAMYGKDYSQTRQWLDGIRAEEAFDYSPIAQLSTYRLESKLAKEMGNSGKALLWSDKYWELRESLRNEEQEYMTHDLEAQYDKAVNEKQLSDAAHREMLQNLALQQKDRLLKYALIALSLFAILGVFLIRQYFTIKKVSEEVAIQNALVTKALLDKELLLKEIHHRVKNNLQVVSSILSIQSRGIEDEKALEAVNESRNRVRSMALIHQDLYQEDDLMGIDTKDYIDKLSNSLMLSYKAVSKNIELHTDVDNVRLDIDTGIPLGLIINELITNCLKYAFPEGAEGRIEVALKEIGDVLELRVADNGIGFDENTLINSNSFGLKMIEAFAQKLDAKWEVLTKGGTEVLLTIKKYKSVTG